MRLLFLISSLMSLSSCVAVVGLGVVGTMIAGTTAREDPEGAEREAHQRVVHAQEAAAIRQRYNEAEKQQPSETQQRTTLLQGAPLPLKPTAPPLVAVEPARKPLRPRAQ